MHALSLVVATLGREAELQRLCVSLRDQRTQDFELIVVDQNHDERALRALAAFPDRTRLKVLRVDGRGAAWARNRGLEHARGHWVAFPDDDCWYEPETLSAVLDAVSADAALDGVVGHWVELGPAPAPAVLDGAHFRRLSGIPASMIVQFYRRAGLEAAGGFDERLGPPAYHAGGEETDLLLRVLARGGRIAACPGVRVHHAVYTPREGAARAAFARVLPRARGTGALYAKHRLAPGVVLRGLGAPWARALGCLHRPARAARELALGVGRAQGWWVWRRRYGRGVA